MFIGYSKGTMRGIFYNPRDKKVFMSTYTTFVENKYMNTFKSRINLLLEEISEKKTPNDSTIVIEKGTDSVTTRVVVIDNEIENITSHSNLNY